MLIWKDTDFKGVAMNSEHIFSLKLEESSMTVDHDPVEWVIRNTRADLSLRSCGILLYIREPAPTVKTVFCLKGIITIHIIYTAQAENKRASDFSTGPPYTESKSVSSQNPIPNLADL